jgi:hypothetical protein
MELPMLPTDNLYKFLALSGLVMLVLSFTFPRNMVDELELKAVESETNINLLAFDVSVLKDDVDAAEKKPKLAEDGIQKLSERQRQLEVKTLQVGGERAKLNVLVKQLRFAMSLSIIGSVLGFVLADIGFWLWYMRVQKPADLLARKQVEATGA